MTVSTSRALDGNSAITPARWNAHDLFFSSRIIIGPPLMPPGSKPSGGNPNPKVSTQNCLSKGIELWRSAGFRCSFDGPVKVRFAKDHHSKYLKDSAPFEWN